MSLIERLSARFAPRKADPASAAGTGGLMTHQAVDQQIASLLQILPDPDELLRQRGLRRNQLKTLSYNDAIRGAMETRRDAVVATPYRLEPAEGDAAAWVAEEIKPHIESATRDGWSAVPYGYAPLEFVYAMREGNRVGLGWVGLKPLQWFDPLRDGTLRLTPPNSGTPRIVDTKFKFLLVSRNATWEQPQGEALLSPCYWLWFFLQATDKGNAKWLERFADPMLSASAKNPQGVVDVAAKLGIDAIIALGQEDKVTALTQGSQGEYARFSQSLRDRINIIWLGQTLTTDVGNNGSFAAAKVHNEVRKDKLQADLRLVRVVGQAMVDRLWLLNGFPGKPPEFVLGEERGLEVDRADRDAKLATAKIARYTKSYLMENYGYEETDIEVPSESPTPDQTDPNSPPTDPNAPPPPVPPKTQTKLSADPPAPRFTPAQQAVEGLVAAAMAEVTLGIPVEDLRAAIKAAADPADLEARLAVLIESRDKERMQKVLSQALFAAQVLGYVASEQGRT